MGAYSRKLRKGTRWWYAGSYLGQTYHSRCIYLTKQEALKAEREKRNEIDEQARSPISAISLKDLMFARLDEIQLKQSDKYYRENRRYFQMLYEFLGDLKASEVSKPDISRFLMAFYKDLDSRGKTAHKVNAALRAFKALYGWGNRVYDLNLQNPCTGIEFYPIDRKLKHIPSDDEILEVKIRCDEEENLLLDFCDETGARVGEALRMTTRDIFDGHVILYTRKSKGSNLIPRKVPCTLDFSGRKGRIFARWTQQPRFLEKRVRKLKQTPWGFHNLRHRRASIWSKEGRPIFEIMSLLGHANLETTQKYLQLLP